MVVDILGSVLLLHRVDKLGCFGVAEISETGDVKSSHHVVIFVDKVVAMEHLYTIIRSVTGDDCNLLVHTK